MSLRTQRLLLAAFVGAAVLSAMVSVRAQDKRDVIDEAKQRQQAVLERIEAEFKQVKDEARSVSDKEPAKAIALLGAFRDKIAANTDVPQESRDQMLRRINILISAYTARAAANAETRRVTQLKAQRGQQEEPPPDIWDLRYFPGPPPEEEPKFPPDWLARIAKRRVSNLTKEERKFMEALATPMSVELKDSTLEAVIDYLKDKSGVKIIVPQSVLDEKRITYKTPVSVALKKVTMRTILKKVLADVGLVYIVKDNTIQVTTEEIASKTITKHTYYMGDLLYLTDLRIPPYAKEAVTRRMIDDVIGMIVGTIEPNSWWVNGGPGRIVFDPRTMTVIVTQTTEVHLMLGHGTANDNR